MAAEEIICAICGAKNPGNIERCRSCGARIDQGASELTDEEAYERRHQQDTFEWKWVLIAAGVFVGLHAVFLALLPIVISAYDPQGLPGIAIAVLLWFVGGIVVGWMSPGKTFVEPAVGALLAAVPTIFWLDYIADVHQQPIYAYIFAALMGVMCTLFGAFLGEKIQMGTRGHAKAR